jgi:acyl-[acyl-carrier-protein]-phospholipid O-acyltransferase/long-chain-fatty-acid--[acyl-carrier-protein] ligase
MFRSLLSSRRFAPVFGCQLLSALNDNFLKNALVILILFQIGKEGGGTLVTLSGAALVAPFFVLSALGGQLADKYDKALVARRLKLAEIPVAMLAAAGFLLQSVPLLFLALSMFGAVAALFGPIKYGILPDHLETRELPAGNALVEGATFLAILVGTIGGGIAAADPDGAGLIALIIVGLAGLSWLSACLIPATGAGAPGLVVTANPLPSTIALVSDLRADRRIWIGALITSWFWVTGIVALSLLPTIVKEELAGDQTVITLCLVVFTIGIAAGSALAALASRFRPNLALVPIGAVVLGLAGIGIAGTLSAWEQGLAVLTYSDMLGSISGCWLLLELLVMALAGGLFIVPSFAAVQSWAPADRRARVVAGVNVVNAFFMTLATALVAGSQHLGASHPQLLYGLGLASIAVAVLVLRAWGKEGMQDVAAFLFRLFYRLEVKGYENLPAPGERAVIAPNHVSLMDGPVMHAILPGHAAFAIDTGIAQAWWVKPFLQLINAHTMDPTKPLATRGLVNFVKQGETLVIFPEGRITVTSGLMKVYDGAAMIADKADAWIVPVRIDGLERSPWSYLRATQTRKSWFPKVTVTILPKRKLEVDASLKGKWRRQAAGAALQDIMIDTAVETASLDQTLFEALVAARQSRDTGRVMIEDPLGTRLSYKKLVLGAQVLGAKLAPLAPEGGCVGVMLPNAAGVAVTFFALQSIGRVPAMINFTAGAANVLAACKAAKVGAVLTSRTFVDKARLGDLVARLEAAVRIVYLEDVRQSVGLADKLKGLVQGSRPQVRRSADAPAAVLFTSGSEGTPKGVVLSHRNILANAVQALTKIAVHGEDKVFNVLPVFHSFGLTGGLIMPLTGGVPVYLYPSPLHYRIVPELVYGSNATILFGTDTFLNGYARAAHPYDFHSLRLIVAGAEAVKQRTRDTYAEKFGVRILEGYGVTETAPVLALNTPLANKAGTVGRLVPLLEARLDPVPGIGEGGRLSVRGPNVMLGYYRAENPGVLEPPKDGWHDTGDIVAVDAHGFITIKGRAKRFAKIGGEMVSLSAVEAMAAELWPGVVSIVVSVPDARKGERLVLLTPEAKASREAFSRHAKARGASELSVPAEIVVVPSVPLLGSGKPDYVTAAALVKERMATTSEAKGAKGSVAA